MSRFIFEMLVGPLRPAQVDDGAIGEGKSTRPPLEKSLEKPAVLSQPPQAVGLGDVLVARPFPHRVSQGEELKRETETLLRDRQRGNVQVLAASLKLAAIDEAQFHRLVQPQLEGKPPFLELARRRQRPPVPAWPSDRRLANLLRIERAKGWAQADRRDSRHRRRPACRDSRCPRPRRRPPCPAAADWGRVPWPRDRRAAWAADRGWLGRQSGPGHPGRRGNSRSSIREAILVRQDVMDFAVGPLAKEPPRAAVRPQNCQDR